MEDSKLLRHLRRIEGQIKGLQKMVTSERQCDDILTQIQAVKAALDRVSLDLTLSNIERCMADMPQEEAHREISKIIHYLSRM